MGKEKWGRCHNQCGAHSGSPHLTTQIIFLIAVCTHFYTIALLVVVFDVYQAVI